MSTPSKPPSDSSVDVFRPGHTALFRLCLGTVALLAAAALYGVAQYYQSPYWNRVGLPAQQPVLFSHRHHVGELRIDCRNCHATVETSAFAGLPSTHTCLACHSQIFTDTAMLRPLVLSAETGMPLHWQRVTHLPDHVYFNHSIHLAKGVGCTTCHGEVGNMALLAKGEPLTMRWCIDCHRDPGPRLRPRETLFAAHTLASDTKSAPSLHSREPSDLLGLYTIQQAHLTNCSTCHH